MREVLLACFLNPYYILLHRVDWILLFQLLYTEFAEYDNLETFVLRNAVIQKRLLSIKGGFMDTPYTLYYLRKTFRSVFYAKMKLSMRK